ncbi:lipoyl(octanoyl) transferase LipB [Actinotalea sp. Marseille-Q4924]|uniref:lipoyl(octanoyl) transferase LipB n=1 Tax=Actinotalea sp. Marseille-Q4924 TaxID=2866571 RepID=UPI001CE49DB6|nr:lipoyl(octanoyl) transferase LipB [Actinotalea sp. Marseille-Q4924]
MLTVDLGLGVRHLPYEPTWALQRAVHADVVDGSRPDTVLLLEHESVYTAGKRTASWDRPVDGTPVVDVDRGGKITWHGPGQLVAYPLVRLRQPVDVVAYVRALEAAVMAVCARLGVTAGRVEGRSGVWVAADDPQDVADGMVPRRDRKVCAIGVRVAKGVTMHGLALNCDPDLGAFGRIVPCGIDDADVTSLSAELGRDVTVLEVLPLLREELAAALRPLRAVTDAAAPSAAV